MDTHKATGLRTSRCKVAWVVSDAITLPNTFSYLVLGHVSTSTSAA